MPPIAFARLVGELLSARMNGRPFDQIDDLTIASGDLVLGLDDLYEDYRCDIGDLQSIVDSYIAMVDDQMAVADSGPLLIPLIRTLGTVLNMGVTYKPFSGGLAVCLGEESDDADGQRHVTSIHEAKIAPHAFDLLYQVGMNELRSRFPKAEAEAAGRGGSMLLQVGAGEGWESSFLLLREFRAWATKQIGGETYFAIPRSGSVVAFGTRGLEAGPRNAIAGWVDGDDALSDQLFWEETGGICSEPL